MSKGKIYRRVSVLLIASSFLWTIYIPSTESSEPPVQLAANNYRSREQLLADFFTLQAKYPQLVSYEKLGETVEGREMYVFKIGNQSAVSKLMFDGACHGNEILGSEVLYYYAVWLLQETEPASLEILHNVLTLIVPIVNVDRYALTRKNAHGVDLNRNFMWNWNGTATTGGGVSDNPSSSHYRGNAPESEAETKLYTQLWNKFKPTHYLNLHTFGVRQIWYSQRTFESSYFLEVYLSYCKLASSRGQPYFPLSECGGTGCYDCTPYHMYGIHGWSCELSQNTPAYSEVPLYLEQWLPLFITLAMQSTVTTRQHGPDLNGDGKVDKSEITSVSSAFGSHVTDSTYDWIVDLNEDGEVDIFDAIIIAIAFGKTLPNTPALTRSTLAHAR